MTRWTIYLALAAIGFGGGAVIFRVGERAVSSGESDDLKLWSARQPSLGTIGVAEDGVEGVRRAKAGGLRSSITSHLNLVADTPVGELPRLLLRLERGVEFDDDGDAEPVTGLACEAIIARLLAEDIDGLLDLALGGRSRYIEKHPGLVVGGVAELLGYEALVAKISVGGIPAVAAELMQTLLFQEIHDDQKVGWARAIDSGVADLDQLAGFFAGPELIELALLSTDHQPLGRKTIQRSFDHFFSMDREAAFAAFDQLTRGSERSAAILGLADSLLHGDFEQAKLIAPRLASDRERIRFYRATLRRKWDFDPFSGGESEWMPDLDRVNAIPEPLVHQQLLREELSTWKYNDAVAAQLWAEENGHLELFERLTLSFPVTPFSPTAYDYPIEYQAPEIPSKFNQIDQADEE